MMRTIEERAHELCNEIGSSSKILTEYLYPVILKALEELESEHEEMKAAVEKHNSIFGGTMYEIEVDTKP
jgi:hypothetical protein